MGLCLVRWLGRVGAVPVEACIDLPRIYSVPYQVLCSGPHGCVAHLSGPRQVRRDNTEHKDGNRHKGNGRNTAVATDWSRTVEKRDTSAWHHNHEVAIPLT